jgi:tetratricopeptide (TPR) repeat protein
MILRNILLILISVIIIYLNFLRLNSFILQPIILGDFANNTISISSNEINKIDYLYPTLAINTIPMSTLVSRYQMKKNNFSASINLCKDGIEANPYLAFSDYQLSRIYTELKMFNKAYHHIEKAYKLSPNIISISALYEALKEIQNNNVN